MPDPTDTHAECRVELKSLRDRYARTTKHLDAILAAYRRRDARELVAVLEAANAEIRSAGVRHLLRVTKGAPKGA